MHGSGHRTFVHYPAKERAVSKQLLEYAPRRGRRFLHCGYLAVTLMCFGLTALSWIIAARTTHIALPDPPPAGDPYWKQLEQDKLGFLAGCVGIPVFAFLGLFFLDGTFAAARAETAERTRIT